MNKNNELVYQPSHVMPQSFSQGQKIEVELELQIGDEVFEVPIEVEIDDDEVLELHFEIEIDLDVVAFKMPDVEFEPDPESELGTHLTSMANIRWAFDVASSYGEMPKDIVAHLARSWEKLTELAFETAANR